MIDLLNALVLSRLPSVAKVVAAVVAAVVVAAVTTVAKHEKKRAKPT
jgi:cell division protein FtsL